MIPQIPNRIQRQHEERRWTSEKWFWVAPLLALCLLLIASLPRWLEPSSRGKSVREWFEEALNDTTPRTDIIQAFAQMEGRTVPFLIRRLNPHPSGLDKARQLALNLLPKRLDRILGSPRPESYYSWRCMTALEMLGYVGTTQRLNLDSRQPTRKPSVAKAVPRIRALLSDDSPSIRSQAAQALWFIGPPAAPAIPELIRLAADANEKASTPAVQAFGLIGPAASNAVELLSQIARSDRRDRLGAIQSLGLIGQAARSATPALVSLLNDEDDQIRVAAARALAHCGETPDAATPTLAAMLQHTNEWWRIVATLALWNRNPNDAGLTEALGKALHSTNRGPLAYSLAYLGTNAAPFLPQLKELADDPDPHIRRFSRIALRRIQTSKP
ncbi:MAG: HEAT repeat domain-containing protein [Verrucomicrobia bacterium]|nr:HEAT repeat domain-containing protein [Verrucomicrobiota bacterium]